MSQNQFLRISTVNKLIDRLNADRNFKRICGYDIDEAIPTESTFSRAFKNFSNINLRGIIHEEVIKTHIKPLLIEHISRDSTVHKPDLSGQQPVFIRTLKPETSGHLFILNLSRKNSLFDITILILGDKMERTKMYKIREVFRLLIDSKMSCREIAASLNIGKSTENDVVKRIKNTELIYTEISTI
ncbi:MAG TPA: hypothetical protein DDY71_00080 [Spirochaetia bacterium]|nr:hypothetical protein [Spirochaetia bacterium]